MRDFSIALLQLIPPSDLQDALVTGMQACHQAKAQGANLALFPELWSIGYDPKKMTPDYALSQDHFFIQQFCKQAQQLCIAIALTYLVKTKTGITNTIILIDQTGNIILDYAKVNICSFDGGSETTLKAGNQYKVADLCYEGGSIKVGAMICFDREFPEPARALAAKGAELILVPNACHLATDPVLSDVRLAQIRSRAFENKVVVAVTNYAAPAQDGSSCVAFVDGTLIAQAPATSTILTSSFTVEKVRSWQKKEPWGPHFY